jgi:Transposase DDE domain
MNQYSELRKALQPHLGWHKARVSFLALFLLALLKVKTVNLSELSLGFGGFALPASNYKRLQRFFRGFELDYAVIAKAVVSWMKIPQPWVLSIDRTTWEFGCHVYNILTIGVVHEGVAIPLLWWMLGKKGNSNSDERMRFIEALLKLFPDAQIKCLCADREFIGQTWLRYLLLEPSMPFRLRIRATDKIERDGTLLASKVMFAHLQVGQSQKLSGVCRVWGYPVAVEALRLEDGSLLVVISETHAAENLLTDYALRWGIETLFGIFKTRGFCLESTHFTDLKRLRKLFALLTLALCWSMHTGIMLNQFQPIVLKKHGRRAKSLFRLGFDYIRQIVLNPSPINYDDFRLSLQFLSCT